MGTDSAANFSTAATTLMESERMKTRISGTSVIQVSRLSDGELFADVRLYGVLPRCRKLVLLTESPVYGGIWLRPLFGHNGEEKLLKSTGL
jgi:hypothetical protein